MNELPCHLRTFPFRISLRSFYMPYLRWLGYLCERLGQQNTLSLWESAFAQYDDRFLVRILSDGWYAVEPEVAGVEDDLGRMVNEALGHWSMDMPVEQVNSLVECTPPVAQIKRLLSWRTVEKEITAYEVLCLRFDGLARIAEALIESYGKQGELIAYDLMVEARLASASDQTGSVEAFFKDFTAQPDVPNLFTAGLDMVVTNQSKTEVTVDVYGCEWARYFHDHHPRVGYLMACSTDEAAYRAFNRNLRLQRTQTLMEGGARCDFRVFSIGDPDTPAGAQA